MSLSADQAAVIQKQLLDIQKQLSALKVTPTDKKPTVTDAVSGSTCLRSIKEIFDKDEKGMKWKDVIEKMAKSASGTTEFSQCGKKGDVERLCLFFVGTKDLQAFNVQLNEKGGTQPVPTSAAIKNPLWGIDFESPVMPLALNVKDAMRAYINAIGGARRAGEAPTVYLYRFTVTKTDLEGIDIDIKSIAESDRARFERLRRISKVTGVNESTTTGAASGCTGHCGNRGWQFADDQWMMVACTRSMIQLLEKVPDDQRAAAVFVPSAQQFTAMVPLKIILEWEADEERKLMRARLAEFGDNEDNRKLAEAELKKLQNEQGYVVRFLARIQGIKTPEQEAKEKALAAAEAARGPLEKAMVTVHDEIVKKPLMWKLLKINLARPQEVLDAEYVERRMVSNKDAREVKAMQANPRLQEVLSMGGVRPGISIPVAKAPVDVLDFFGEPEKDDAADKVSFVIRRPQFA